MLIAHLIFFLIALAAAALLFIAWKKGRAGPPTLILLLLCGFIGCANLVDLAGRLAAVHKTASVADEIPASDLDKLLRDACRGAALLVLKQADEAQTAITRGDPSAPKLSAAAKAAEKGVEIVCQVAGIDPGAAYRPPFTAPDMGAVAVPAPAPAPPAPGPPPHPAAPAPPDAGAPHD